MADVIRGYKAFDTDADGGLCCRDMAYEVGKSYTLDGRPMLCERGYHFCRRLVDCYNFYANDSRICEVEAWGTVIDGGSGKSVTDHIRIIRELDRHEVLDLANVGRDCTGIRNSGYRNSGNYNSGDYNSGDDNSGYYNSGYRNSGDGNSGDYNKSNFSSGVLCTQEHECLIFDKPSGMTLREWRDTDAAALMDDIGTDGNRWICLDDMTDAERAAHPGCETVGGYLHVGTGKPDYAGWWDGLSSEERATILAIPNFDADKWLYITGIDVAGDAS